MRLANAIKEANVNVVLIRGVKWRHAYKIMNKEPPLIVPVLNLHNL